MGEHKANTEVFREWRSNQQLPGDSDKDGENEGEPQTSRVFRRGRGSRRGQTPASQGGRGPLPSPEIFA